MALIKCKECKNDISDTVGTVCPKCGFSLTEDYLIEYKEQSRKKGIIYFQVFFNVLIYVAAIYLFSIFLKDYTSFNKYILPYENSTIIKYINLYLEDNLLQFFKLKAIHILLPILTVFLFPIILYILKLTTLKNLFIVIIFTLLWIALLLSSYYIFIFFFVVFLLKAWTEPKQVKVVK